MTDYENPEWLREHMGYAATKIAEMVEAEPRRMFRLHKFGSNWDFEWGRLCYLQGYFNSAVAPTPRDRMALSDAARDWADALAGISDGDAATLEAAYFALADSMTVEAEAA